MKRMNIAGLATAVALCAAGIAAAQEETKQWIYMSNAVGDPSNGRPVVRLDPDAPPDEAVSGILNLPQGDIVEVITPVPSSTFPTHLLLASRQGWVRRLSLDLQVLSQVNVGGWIRGCTLMPELNCYAVTHMWDGTTSDVALSFVNLEATQVLQMGVSGSTGHLWGRGLVYSHWDNNTPADPTDDAYRLYWMDLAPAGPPWHDSLQMLQITYDEAVVSNGSDPFNPADDTLGPPFRGDVWDTQMGSMPPSRYRTALLVVGADDSRIALDAWKGPNGHDYVIGGRARVASPTSIVTDVFGFDGSDHTRPGNVLVAATPQTLNATSLNGVVTTAFDNETEPAFHRIEVMKNTVGLTHGLRGTSFGGTRVGFYHMAPAAGNTPLTFTPANTFGGTEPGLVFPNGQGCSGILADYFGDHVYVGSDDSANVLLRLPVVPLANHLTTPRDPPVNALQAENILVYTPAEQLLANPPERFWPLQAGAAVLTSLNPVDMFDGNGLGASGGGFGSCAAIVVPAAPLALFFGALLLAGGLLRRS